MSHDQRAPIPVSSEPPSEVDDLRGRLLLLKERNTHLEGENGHLGDLLKEQNLRLARLEALLEHSATREATVRGLEALAEENDRLRHWVDDLQAGQWVNCVYCGHRYGPGETTPVTMADALKAHVETCPAHPMSALKVENARLEAKAKEGLEFAQVCLEMLNDVTIERDRQADWLERYAATDGFGCPIGLWDELRALVGPVDGP